MRNDEHCIFHVDVNSAFLSWSALKKLEEDPESTDLRTIPSAVGGDTATRHGAFPRSCESGFQGIPELFPRPHGDSA